MIDDWGMERGMGKTTEQVKNASKDAIYVWPTHHLIYIKELVKHLGREDLKIVTTSYISLNNCRGSDREIVLDHAYDVNLSFVERVKIDEIVWNHNLCVINKY